MIRRRIVAVLVDREVRRLRKNPSALMLIGLLSAVALLMVTSRPELPGTPSVNDTTVTAAEHEIWLTYNEPSGWTDHLAAHLPSSAPTIRMVPLGRIPVVDGELQFPAGSSIIELQTTDMFHAVTVIARYDGDTPHILDPFWDWFWPTTLAWHADGLQFEKHVTKRAGKSRKPSSRSLEDTSLADFVKAELIGTVLLLIIQFFSCCHLLVSFMSQDRERGTLSALVMSPAHLSEILFAKCIFHLCLSLLGCIAIVTILKPAALLQPLLWVTIVLTSVGLMCVGTCITTFARSQTSAGLLALCYMLACAVVFYLASRFSAFALLRQFTFENYSFPLLYATLKHPATLLHNPTVWNLAAIVVIWAIAARHCFYRFGWR